MADFWSSDRFRFAWVVSLISGAFHPIVSAALRAAKGTEPFSLRGVAETVWPDSVVFFVLLFALNFVGAFLVWRRDQIRKDEQE